MRPPQPLDDFRPDDEPGAEDLLVRDCLAKLRRSDLMRDGWSRINPPPDRPKPPPLVTYNPPAYLDSPVRAAMLDTDARALHAREQATAAALKRLEERATQAAESRRHAYYAGKADAESRLFWVGALFGAVLGAALLLVYLQPGLPS
ncbi:hypothetical protein [Methylibium sp.]|uniref:hypothetical protein n=1 Tax=Methylibium sp. TaxID=2067992 RepID=UPI003D13875B